MGMERKSRIILAFGLIREGGSEGCRQRSGAGTIGLPGQQTSAVLYAQVQGEVGRGEEAACTLRPFDQCECARIEVVAHAEELEFLRIGKAVKVVVQDLASRKLVRLDQRIGGALDLAFVAKRLDQAAAQCGLAATEVALQRNQASALEQARQRLTEGKGGLFVGQPDGTARHGFSNLRSQGKRSLASSPRMPSCSLQRSAALLCRHTPRRVASARPRPWASRPP